MGLSTAQQAQILALLVTHGGLSLGEIQARLRPELRDHVWDTLEFARRHGYIELAPALLPDGSPATEAVWLIAPAGHEFIIDARSPYTPRARRMANEVGNQLARTWIPVVILITVTAAIRKHGSIWNWILMAEAIFLGPVAYIVTALINRRTRRSILIGR